MVWLFFPLPLLIYPESILVAGQRWGLEPTWPSWINLTAPFSQPRGSGRVRGKSVSHGSCLHFIKDFFHKCGLLISVSYSPPALFCHTVWVYPLVSGAILAQGMSAYDPLSSSPFSVLGQSHFMGMSEINLKVVTPEGCKETESQAKVQV